jgi:hypothetical protein
LGFVPARSEQQMKFASIAIGLALILPLALANPSYAARRVALVIGNADYLNAPALLKPGNDANAMATMFRQAGFDVVIAQSNTNLAQLHNAIAEFKSQAANSDIAVAYFAGYGVDIQDVNYLLPVDAKFATARDATTQAITLDSLASAAGGAKRLRLVIVDALHGDPFPAGKAESDDGLIEPAPQAGTLIAYSTTAETVSEEGDGAESIYTAAVLRNLFTPGLDIRLAFGRLLVDVLKTTAERQTPFVYGSLGSGNISLVPAPADRPMMDLAGEKTDYRVVEKINTAHAWEVFMVQHPSGFYFASARDELRLAETEAAPEPQQAPRPHRPETATREEVPPLEPPAGAPDLATPALVALAQQELARLGCYGGTTTGALDPATREALSRYEKAQGQPSSGEVQISRSFLAELEKQTGRVCPLTCAVGQTARGNRCVDATTSAPVTGHNEPQPSVKRPTRPTQAPPAVPPRSSGQASTGTGHTQVQPGVGF